MKYSKGGFLGAAVLLALLPNGASAAFPLGAPVPGAIAAEFVPSGGPAFGQHRAAPAYSDGYRLARHDDPDFTVHNASPYSIYYIYVSPVQSDSWGPDVLGDRVVLSGYSIEIDVYVRQCRFDVRIEDSAGYYREYGDVDLCSINSITYE